ncbi:MAG: chemotaxis protein CheB [Burkholderiaceae bacterium]|nr:chemotaxis protein CheB [Burkholderiaceae bacterium]
MSAVARPATDLTLVGIGASAGGLDALLALFAQLPRTGRLGYVVAQHMASGDHTDLVLRLLQRASLLPVERAQDGQALGADRVYLVPAGHDAWVDGRHLRLEAPDPRHTSTPSVNRLLISLAAACGASAVGLLLSGAGHDGAAGCQAIRAAGGLTLAQDPAEALFDGMPRAAIDRGAIDQVLGVAQMAALLRGRFPACVPPAGAMEPARPPTLAESQAQEALHEVLRQVQAATGVDFSRYKEETLLRRLEQRKAELGLASIAAYRQWLRDHPQELQTLQNLFLVSVSSFFRDAEAFAALALALGPTLAGQPPGQAVRIWVPACAGGEEAYTLAILVHEWLQGQREPRPVAILATDLNPEALAVARRGIYRAGALQEVSPARRARYFIPHGADFAIHPDLQAWVQFEQGDVLTQPAPSGLDLVSCRNLLIYMRLDLQERLLQVFRDSLRPQGLLFMGLSESLGPAGSAWFRVLDYFHRVYVRKPDPARPYAP